MTTMTSAPKAVTGRVDTHADVHVAAACDQLGAVLGTRAFPTTARGYRQLLAWLRSFGTLERVGVEGTGSYGVGLTRALLAAGVDVVEVLRPNRQTRRRHGKTDVVDAVAAARAVLTGEATGQPKAHDGDVEALRLLKMVHRSAHKARTQALLQIRDVITTAPDELRDQLRGMRRRELLATCAAFRPAGRDDLVAITKLTPRALARRIAELDAELAELDTRRRRITTAIAPQLCARTASDPTPPAGCYSRPTTTLTGSAASGPGRRYLRPTQSKHLPARSSGIGSTAAATVRETVPCGGSSSSA